jgi:kynureninase
MARLLGAAADEVIMADSTSVNLFKLALASLALRPGRHKIITDNLNFPSDLYILQSVCRLAGQDYRLVRIDSPDGIHGQPEALAEAIDEDTALVALSHTTFKSSFTYDLPAISEIAHRAGALMLWDTSHSVGTRPIELNRAAVDLAIGCSYKYINGGPGGPAFLYVRRDLQPSLLNPISGWMGQHQPFDFSLEYQADKGIRRFLTGTPAIISLAAVEGGIDLLLEAGLERVRQKSLQQTEYLIALWKVALAPLGYHLKTPRDPDQRGSHVTLGHQEGLRIDRALIEQLNVLSDFRPPDNIRLGIAPLYNTYEELFTAVLRLVQVIEDGLFRQYSEPDLPVT